MANETVYNIAKGRFTAGTLDWDTTDIRVALIEGAIVSGAYDPDLDNIAAVFAASAEAAGTGYVRKTLDNRVVTVDDTNNRATLFGDALVWSGANFGTARAILVYIHVDGTDANDIPISFHDAGFPIVTNGGDLTVNWAGAGDDEVLYLT